MTPFSRILEAIDVKFDRINLREVVNPIQLDGFYGDKNVLVQLNKGHLFAGKENTKLQENACYFVPMGQDIFIKHGKADQYKAVGHDGFPTHDEWQQYVKYLDIGTDVHALEESFTLVWFDVLLYNTISFFSILELPAFTLPYNEEIDHLIRRILEEERGTAIGKKKMQHNLAEELVLIICRYIDSHPEFSKCTEKVEYLLDRRLMNIIHYIHDNLDKDLSNKKLAEIAFVSEDYVGQFFKTLTSKNLQDYVENQRLDRALYLIRTRNDSIQEIAHQVGFKDPAYFSRRFKMKFGQNANTIRKSDNFMTM
jgi:AraC-like DNA-binding protein